MDERIRLLEDLAHPVRYGALRRLEHGPATASALATALGVSATVLANHLRRLREHGLVEVRHTGRHATYALAEPGLRELFSVLNELRAPPPADPPPSVEASTCFDHLGGRVGVALYDALVDAGAIVPGESGVRLGDDAEPALATFGVAVPDARRRLMAYACLDAAEGRPHLGGALGAALAARFAEQGWVVPEPGSRRATVTPAGRRALRRLL